MRLLRRATVTILTLLSCLVMVPAVLAHPLGNFTINHYAGLQIGQQAVVIDYVMDMAEIAAFQEIELLDANGNGQPDPAEAAGYHALRCAALQPSLRLSVNRKPAAVSLAASSVEFPPGVGGLLTMRLTCEFRASIDASQGSFPLTFHNQVFADRPGWQEIVVIPDGVRIEGDHSSTSLSQRLTAYPEDLLTSPLQQRLLEVDVIPAGLPGENPASVPASVPAASTADRNDAFTRLILLEELTPSTLLLALAISFVWGAAHALTPGHGKTIVGAYLVGSRGTTRHAVYLGLTTTITHTLGVFALGLVTLFAAQYVVPESLYPWMTLLSGAFVVAIGVNLLVARFRSSGIQLPRLKAGGAEPVLTPLLQPGLLQGQAIEKPHTHKYVLRGVDHDSGAHSHSHSHGHAHAHDGHHHHHGPGSHSHLPPEQITWRSLLALGVSGGLIPCPSALVVLLGAIALNKIGLGLVLVLAFSLGLAATLTAIGVLFIYAGRLFERFPARGRVMQLIPVLSALFVSALGAAIIWKALAEIAA